MKLIRSLILLLSLGLTSIQSHAVVGTLAGLTGNLPAAKVLSLSGLAMTGYGIFSPQVGDNQRRNLMWTFLGLVLLDEGGDIEFDEISYDLASVIGITETEFKSYHIELEEINIVFNEVSHQVEDGMDQDEVASIWDQYSLMLSKEAFSAMKKIVNHQ